MTPTYITFKNPYGGLGLRALTAAKAFERVEGLFAACAAELRLETVSLRVGDPCSAALAADLGKEHLDGEYRAGSTQISVAAVGGLRFEEPVADLIARHDHVPREIAAEALEAFGPPNVADLDVCGGVGPIVFWVWDLAYDTPAEGTGYAPLADKDAEAAYADWSAFLRKHHRPIFEEYNPQVLLGAEWAFRMKHPVTGEPAGDEYPLSRVDATLSGRWSSAFLELVFPFAEPDDEFVLAYEKVNEGLGMKLPAKALRMDSATKKGDRKWTKLPPWTHG